MYTRRNYGWIDVRYYDNCVSFAVIITFRFRHFTSFRSHRRHYYNILLRVTRTHRLHHERPPRGNKHHCRCVYKNGENWRQIFWPIVPNRGISRFFSPGKTRRRYDFNNIFDDNIHILNAYIKYLIVYIYVSVAWV